MDFRGVYGGGILLGLLAVLAAAPGCKKELEVTVSKTVIPPGPDFGGGVPTTENTSQDIRESNSDVQLDRRDRAGEASTPALFYHVAITEILYDPITLPDAAGEWIEISNLGKAPIPLDELEVISPGGTSYLGLKAKLMPGGVAVIARFPFPSATPWGLVPDAVASNLLLPNTQGFVEIRIGDAVLDRVEYSVSKGFPDPSGASLSLDNDAYSTEENDSGGAWCVGQLAYAPNELGTPGLPNPHCDTPLVAVPPSEGGGASEQPDSPIQPEPGDEPPVGSEGNSGGDTREDGEEEETWWEEDEWEWDWEEDEWADDWYGSEEEEDPWEDWDAGDELGTGKQSLVITEVHFTPQASPDEKGEWIELTNLSSWKVDLRGLTLMDNASLHLINGPKAVWIGPYDTIVLGRSDDPDENGGIQVDYQYSGIVLNNTGDSLALLDGDTTLDQVVFGPSVGQPVSPGASLQLSPDSTSVFANDVPAAWCLSTQVFGWGDTGTPGENNPPCFQEPSNSGPSGPYSALLFSEMMVDPDAVLDAKGEWIELFNSGDAPVDVRGLSLEDALGTHTIAGAVPLMVEPGGYFVLGRNGSEAQNGGVVVDHVYGEVTLNNTGDVITLSFNGEIIDSVAYDKASGYALEAGKSIMNEALSPGGNSADWCVSGTPYGEGDRGSPGEANGNCGP